MGAGTLNSAIQKAAGANKDIFTCVVMHSVVATNLENLQLLEYVKYNDAGGVERDLSLATWNGRTVLVDDDVPVEAVAATETEAAYNKYTTYVLGAGAFDYCDCGADQGRAGVPDHPAAQAVRPQGLQLCAAGHRHHQPHRRAAEDRRPLGSGEGFRRDGVLRFQGDPAGEDHLPRLRRQ